MLVVIYILRPKLIKSKHIVFQVADEILFTLACWHFSLHCTLGTTYEVSYSQ